jgi:GNAT superfamily N-acetyltransferase
VSAIFVRAAEPGQEADLASLQLRSWRSGNVPGLPRDLLQSASEVDIAAGWRAAIAAPPSPRHRVLVASDDARVVGFAAVAPAADPDLPPGSEGELVVLVVDPAATRQGHGSRLLNAAMDHLRQDGFPAAVTWVPAGDEALRGFLADAGWGPDGAWRDLETPDGGTLRQVRLHTSLVEG